MSRGCSDRCEGGRSREGGRAHDGGEEIQDPLWSVKPCPPVVSLLSPTGKTHRGGVFLLWPPPRSLDRASCSEGHAGRFASLLLTSCVARNPDLGGSLRPLAPSPAPSPRTWNSRPVSSVSKSWERWRESTSSICNLWTRRERVSCLLAAHRPDPSPAHQYMSC